MIILNRRRWIRGICLATAVGLAASLAGFAQDATGESRAGDRLTLALGSDRLVVQVCKDDLLKVDFQPDGRTSPDTPSIGTESWPAVQASFDVASTPMTISTGKMVIKIDRAPCRISVYDANHRLLVSENGPRVRGKDGVDFTSPPGSHFYGLKGWQFLDDSNGQMEMTPNPAPYAIRAGNEGNTGGPLVWSNQGFGIYVDTDGGNCRIASPEDLQFAGLSKIDTEYFVMVGSPYDIQESVADLTGRPPMFPKWALGFSNSEFADMNEALCLNNVNGYRSRGIPFDLYTFDFQWKAWGEDNYGEWRWNPTNFPGGPSGAFKARMAALGVKLAGIMKPRVHVDSVQGRYATAHGFWVPGRAPYADYFSHRLVNDLDFPNADCRQWFWQHAEAAFDSGIVGWWNDEADAWDNTWEFMDMQRALYEGQREHTNGTQRVWSINRNFYSGSQRYAYATWSGDIESGFTVMQQQRERLMCSLNIGQARWGMDTGGFNNNQHVSGDEYSESYARWMEFAAFVPIFRTHGTFYKQPWLFGAKAEAAAARAIKLRYSLIPYLYAYDRLLNQTGIGLCRPLIWDYPGDPECANRVDAWMFGDYLLVAPVVDRGQAAKDIYLPAGSWIDYFRGTRYRGGRTLSYPVDPSVWQDIPLFIKNGAIIPSMDVMNYVGEKPVLRIYVDVFPDPSPTSFSYYDDDGATYDYEHGAFYAQVMTAQDRDGTTTLNLAQKIGSYAPPLKDFICKIHGRAGAGVTVNNQPAVAYANYNDLLNGSTEGWANGSDQYGAVTYVKVAAGAAKNLVVLGARP